MTLAQTKGFVPLCLMIFLNAFIDLGHKITIQNIIFKTYDGSEQIVLTAIVNALILLPYIFFFVPAGLISDKFSKTLVLRATASSVFIITTLLAACYYYGLFWLAFALTFLLSIQSAFYSPAKLGLLRELVDNKQLSKANGIAQALTTMGILFGTLCFSILFEQIYKAEMTSEVEIISHMHTLALYLIALGILEAGLSFLIPIIQAQDDSGQKIQVVKLFEQKTLAGPVIGLAAFWCIGQMLLATYPAFAKETLLITNTVVIQAMLALIAIGVTVGSIIAGVLSNEYIQQRLILIAGLMIITCLSLLPITTQIYFAGLIFFITGFAGGLFIVPLLATFQFSSEPKSLGQNLANNNLIQNIAMTTCLVLTAIAAYYNMSSKHILLLNVFIAVGAIIYIDKILPHIRHELFMPYGKNKKIILKNSELINGYNTMIFHCTHEAQPLLQQVLPNKLEPISKYSYRHQGQVNADTINLNVELSFEQKHAVTIKFLLK